MAKIHCFDVRISKEQNSIEKFLLDTKKELDVFFGINALVPNCFLVESRKQFDGIWGKKTEPWQVAWVNENNIFIINPKNYTKESNHKNPEGFWKVLKHEYAHIYYRKLSGGTNKPKWLNEGLAKYLAKQSTEEITQEESLEVFNLYDSNSERIFSVGKYWVNFLISKFGHKKIITLIKSLNGNDSEDHFKKIFFKVYGFEFIKEELRKTRLD